MECYNNKKSFKVENFQYFVNDNYEITEAIHPNQYGLSDYRGGIIVFSTDVNSLNISKNKIYNWFSKKVKSIGNKLFVKTKLGITIKNFNNKNKFIKGEKVNDYIGVFSIGNFFSGRYIGDNKKVYDEKSLNIEINRISSKGLIYFAEEIANDFDQETVLVKDLNKIFLVNNDKQGSYDLSNINKKSI